jgi:MFS family permease
VDEDPAVTRRTRDITLLFAARFARMFAYGLLSLVLVLYLARIGIDHRTIGVLVSATFAGDLVISTWMTTRADRVGRRRVLVAGALLMALAAVAFLSTRALPLLLVAAIIGVISPGGNDVGPFLPVEQAALSQELEPSRRTHLYAWYNLAGAVATALGALASGALVGWSVQGGRGDLFAYRSILFGYAGVGLVLAAIFSLVTRGVETGAPAASSPWLGLDRSSRTIVRLSALFALDSFAGGFILQSFLVYWFVARFHADPRALGALFFSVGLLSGLSGLVAARLAGRFGLVRTMVYTHLPSNVLLILVPFMPTFGLAVAVFLLRSAISQMDVPTRQSFVASLVAPHERSAAGGITNVFRSLGTMLSPVLVGLMFASARTTPLPFLAAGGLKIVYDLALLATFGRDPARGSVGRASRTPGRPH